MNYIPNMNRRSFLIGTAAAGGGLAIGIPFAPESASAQTALSTPELGVWSVWSWGWGTFDSSGADADKAVAACTYLWTRDPVLCDALAQGGVLTKVQQAWVAHDVPQCGYCQCGMIMAVSALLAEKPKPTDKDIDEAITNICRCGTFQQVREAIHAAANA